MGKDNPESFSAVIARNSDVFIADTLSFQNKNRMRICAEFIGLSNP
ncbi:MAG: hypothetical protein IJU91_00850 [Selenomonadaceae bacterium]|nr:hypothetical protein [Selenomonadaceae bacterium]